MVRNLEAAVGIARGVLYAAAQCCVAASLAVCDAVVHAVFRYCAGVFWSTFGFWHLVVFGAHASTYACAVSPVVGVWCSTDCARVLAVLLEGRGAAWHWGWCGAC